MRTEAQISWHGVKLLHDADRRALGVKQTYRPVAELTGPFRLTSADGLVVTGLTGRQQRQMRTAVTVLELRTPTERRYVAIRADCVERLEEALARLNAALGFDEGAAAAAIDAVRDPRGHRPGRWKAVLGKKRQDLARAAIAFHTRNRLRSTAYPWTAFGLAVANVAIAVMMTRLSDWSRPGNGGVHVLAAALSGLFHGLSYWSGAAVVVYLYRALYVRPEKRAAAEAQLAALTSPSARPR